jgi:ABC-type antimicrobial peptide transport system permease subunit
VRSIDPQLVITNLRSMREQIDRSLHQERLLAALSSSFGFLALVLACVGLYGVMAYGVARRTTELSIRRALGATQSQVMNLVLRESALVVGAGVSIAVPAVIISGGLVRNLLYGLTPADPDTIATAVLLVFVVGLSAAFFPARRASRLNPMLGLRAN